MLAPEHLAELVDLLPDGAWTMRPAERLAIVALLEVLRPARTLGLGQGARECTEWLSRYSGQVVCVDIDPAVLEYSERAGNVQCVHAPSQDAMIGFASREEHFDLALVTAAETLSAARDDLLGAAALADVVLVYDTLRAASRAGYVEALRQMNVYADLDLVAGCLAPDGPRGGLGIIISTVSRVTPRHSAAHYPTAEILLHEHRVLSQRGFRLQHALRLLGGAGRRDLALFPLEGGPATSKTNTST